MPDAKYLLVGSSHAALEALRAIRQVDPEGSMAMLTRDEAMPYSPTILPYVVSGRTRPEAAILRDEAFFRDHRCTFVAGEPAARLDSGNRIVTLFNGEKWSFERLLVATGAAPAIPPVPGLDTVRFHVLRTLADAVRLRRAMGTAKRAVVMGAGLVGLHAAETLAEAGLSVTVVEREPQVLPGAFDPKAAGRIADAYRARGIRLALSCTAARVEPLDGGASITLDDGRTLDADLLLVATGVRPAVSWLEGSGVETDRGVLVDERMRTSVAGVWAAGDVAQALDFHAGKPGLIGIIPTAVEQGRTAGFDMAGDGAAKPYAGGLAANTYRFFGRVALSIGKAGASEGARVIELDEPARYRRIVLEDGRLAGFSSVDEPFDLGIMGELMRRRVDLTPVLAEFAERPHETGRRLMSRMWR